MLPSKSPDFLSNLGTSNSKCVTSCVVYLLDNTHFSWVQTNQTSSVPVPFHLSGQCLAGGRWGRRGRFWRRRCRRGQQWRLWWRGLPVDWGMNIWRMEMMGDQVYTWVWGVYVYIYIYVCVCIHMYVCFLIYVHRGIPMSGAFEGI